MSQWSFGVVFVIINGLCLLRRKQSYNRNNRRIKIGIIERIENPVNNRAGQPGAVIVKRESKQSENRKRYRAVFN